MGQTILTVTVCDDNVVQETQCFVGNDEASVVKAAEKCFRELCEKEFGEKWTNLTEEEKEGCLDDGYFDNVYTSKVVCLVWPTVITVPETKQS